MIHCSFVIFFNSNIASKSQLPFDLTLIAVASLSISKEIPSIYCSLVTSDSKRISCKSNISKGPSLEPDDVSFIDIVFVFAILNILWGTWSN